MEIDNRVYSFMQKGTNFIVEVNKDFFFYHYWVLFMKPDKRCLNGYRYVTHEIVPFKDGDGDPITIEDIMNKFNLVANY